MTRHNFTVFKIKFLVSKDDQWFHILTFDNWPKTQEGHEKRENFKIKYFFMLTFKANAFIKVLIDGKIMETLLTLIMLSNIW